MYAELIANINKGQSNLAKSVIPFHQVAAHIAKFVLWGAFAFETPILGDREVLGGQQRYHWKERLWFPIGCPLLTLHYL